ncbi:hypothetical protein WMF18_03795 [Sorangium sp. So ce315]|uniref:hypothetical protein n=1 Tax=Sorangium sp. So ce315 TaxID=3133299 RepID=UPI003F647B37
MIRSCRMLPGCVFLLHHAAGQPDGWTTRMTGRPENGEVAVLRMAILSSPNRQDPDP